MVNTFMRFLGIHVMTVDQTSAATGTYFDTKNLPLMKMVIINSNVKNVEKYYAHTIC